MGSARRPQTDGQARAARRAVATTFFAHALIAGTLGPWIPRLKADNGLDAAELGIALAGFASGLVLGTRLAGVVARAIGGRASVRIGIPVLALALALLPLADGLPTLTVLFAILGAVSGLLDVAMNTEAVVVERRFGRRVMSLLHGSWSVAALVGAALASGAIALGIGLTTHFVAVALVVSAASFPLLRSLPSDRGSTVAEVGEGDGVADPPRRLILLCAAAAGSFLAEGVALEWSAVYLREGVAAGAAIAGLGVVAFSAGMTASRVLGDRAAARVGGARLARIGAAVGGVALAGALAVGGAAPAIVALGVLGLGLGPVVPLAFRAGATLRRRGALGLVVTAGYLGSIVGPIAVGVTAEVAGLRAAFLIPVATCVVIAATGGAIDPASQEPAGTNRNTGPDSDRT
jgi:MFS family permease